MKIKTNGNKLKRELYGCYRTQVHSKAFAIPIMNAAVCLYNVWYDKSQNKEVNIIELSFILQQPLSSIINLFPCF